MALISAFSVGLASVLIVIGLMVVSTRHWFERFPVSEGFSAACRRQRGRDHADRHHAGHPRRHTRRLESNGHVMFSKSLLADTSTKTKIAAVLTLLVAANVLLWLLVWSLSGKFPFLLATGWLAYGFGLRHAVDADHISAIDNTTRKLMQEGKRPVGVGFFFSLGHSTIVISAVRRAGPLDGLRAEAHAAVAGPRRHRRHARLRPVPVCHRLHQPDRAVEPVQDLPRHPARRKTREDQHMGDMLDQRGLLGRLFKPVLKMVRHSWQMYFVGFLFGLGFDTASEVGILALSARSGPDRRSLLGHHAAAAAVHGRDVPD